MTYIPHTSERSSGSHMALGASDFGTGVADSSTVLHGDLTWSAPSGGAAIIVPERRTGLPFPAGPWGIQAGTNGTITLDKLFAIPFYVGQSQSFDRISVNALGTASSFMRLGVYADDNGQPGALTADYGQVATSSSGAVTITISLTASGLIWIAAVGQGVAPSTTRLGTAVVNPWVPPSNHYSVSFTATAYSQSSVSGSLPSPWGSTFNIEQAANTIPMVWLRTS